MKVVRPGRRAGAVVASLLAVGLLAACDDSDTESTSATTEQGAGDAQMQEIQECLTAAGIEMPTPSDMPTGEPTDMPTGTASGTPTGAPPDGGPGGGGDLFSDADVVAALEACGITVPTGGPPDGAGAPTATSTATSS